MFSLIGHRTVVYCPFNDIILMYWFQYFYHFYLQLFYVKSGLTWVTLYMQCINLQFVGSDIHNIRNIWHYPGNFQLLHRAILRFGHKSHGNFVYNPVCCIAYMHQMWLYFHVLVVHTNSITEKKNIKIWLHKITLKTLEIQIFNSIP